MARSVVFILVCFMVVRARAAVIFNATVGYSGTVATRGVETLKLAGPKDLWPGLCRPGIRNPVFPDFLDLDAQARLGALAVSWSAQGLKWICFDIEYLKPVEDPGACNRFLITFARVVRKAAPGLKVGFYGLPPIRDYWRVQKGFGSPAYQAWRAENRALMPAGEAMDAIFPSLYTFYTDQAGWIRYATANIAEAKRYGKPVYPFLWPRYHDSNKRLAWQPLELDYWDKELATVFAQADGAVIWDWGKGKPWDESAPWWMDVKKYAH
jgi:hypothetical protein